MMGISGVKPPSRAEKVLLLLCPIEFVACIGKCHPKVSKSSIWNDHPGVGVVSAGCYVAASVISVTCFKISLVASFRLSCTTLLTKVVISVVRPPVKGNTVVVGDAGGAPADKFAARGSPGGTVA